MRSDSSPGLNQAAATPGPIATSTSPITTPSVEMQTKTEQPDRLQLRDLAAQEDMASWAMWMFIATAITTAISIYVAVVVTKTLKATADAAGYAKTMADEAQKASAAATTAASAAQETNALMAVAGQRQDRAYIAVQPGGINRTGSGEAMGDVIIRNVGKIPAHSIDTQVNMRLNKSRSVRSFSVRRTRRTVDRSIQPGDEIRRSSTENLEIKAIDNEGVYVFVWGVVYYTDGFGVERSTRFCHRYPGSRVNRTPLDLRPARERGLAMFARASYEDELILPKEARHHFIGNASD